MPKKRWLASIQAEEQTVTDASTSVAIVIAITKTSISFVNF